ncbi:MAG: translesion error-prone DNA polymerase V autoproteolytic subunit [Parachlamydiales bacterium]|jgi:DNA polymerase V
MINKKISLHNAVKNKSLQLPLFLTPVTAGFASPADDYLEKQLDLNEFLIKNPPATFFVKVEGDSMKDALIFDGDILIVDRSIEAVNDKIVIASLFGEFTVKRLKIIGKDIFLKAENQEYKAIKITDAMNFEIFGVVTYIIHKAK